LRIRKGHVRRFQKIINTLIRHGFGQLIYELGLYKLSRRFPFPRRRQKKQVAGLSKAVRIRLAVEELGPTFIKLAQLLSTRSDLIPEEYLSELRKLQDQAAPFPFTAAKEILEKELNSPLNSLFEYIEEEPVAAASIGQVHNACLYSGEKVVVKIQRPNINETIKQDVEILKDIAAFLDRRTRIGQVYEFTRIVEEFDHVISMELNYYHEGRNAERLKKNFQEDNNLYIPQIYWSYTTQKVLTMESVEGVKLNDIKSLKKNQFSTKNIAQILSRAYLRQVLLDGFFHGDPHPGNIGVLDDNRLYFLDFGISGSLNEEERRLFSYLLMGFLFRDIDQVIYSIINLGVTTEDTDRKQLRWDLENLQEKYYELPLREINLGESMHELMNIAFKQHIRLPAEFSLLAKTFFTLEGVISSLEPKFSIAELVEPFGREVIKKQFSFKKLLTDINKNASKYLHLTSIFPERFKDILEKGAEGNLKFRIEFSEGKRIIYVINNAVNRLSFSIVLASIIVGLALVMQAASEIVIFWGLPLVEVGLLLAAVMGFWWLWSILRSGKL